MTRDEKEAHRIAKTAKLEEMEHAALAGGAALTAAVKMAGITSAPVYEAIEEFIEERRRSGCQPNTLRLYHSMLSSWMKLLGLERRLVNDVKPEDIDTYVNLSDDTGLATRNLRLVILRMFFARQGERHRVLHDPTVGVGVRRDGLTQQQLLRKVTHTFTDDEWQRMYDTARTYDPFLRFLLVLGRDCALRPVDIASIELVNVGADEIRISVHKTGRELALPITPSIREIMPTLPKVKGGPLFPSYHRMFQLGYGSNLNREFKRLMVRSGVVHGTMRSLRKMAAKRVKAAAASDLEQLIEDHAVRKAQQRLGHRDAATTKKFYLDSPQPITTNHE